MKRKVIFEETGIPERKTDATTTGEEETNPQSTK
jgi:hypothetical protein